MNYSLEFVESALKEWRKLDSQIREQFKKKLAEQLKSPPVSADRLSGMPDCYKIKLRAVGYRLVYPIDDRAMAVTVMATGRRDKRRVYRTAHVRTGKR